MPPEILAPVRCQIRVACGTCFGKRSEVAQLPYSAKRKLAGRITAAKEWDRLLTYQPKDHAHQNQAQSREREIPPGRPFHLAINLLAIHRYGESESPRTL